MSKHLGWWGGSILLGNFGTKLVGFFCFELILYWSVAAVSFMVPSLYMEGWVPGKFTLSVWPNLQRQSLLQ